MKRGALILCLCLAAAQLARANSGSVSYSVWSIDGNTVILRFLLPANEAARLTGSEIPVLTSSKLASYVLQHVGVEAAGKACAAIDQGYDIGQVDPLAVGTQLYGFELVFRCPAQWPLVLQDSVLFERSPLHLNFARLQIGSRYYEQLFTADRQALILADARAVNSVGLERYVWLGTRHILRSADQLCFLVAALLLLARLGNVLSLLGALSIGYALSMVADAAGWELSGTESIDAWLGMLVALMAIAAILDVRSERRRTVQVGAALVLVLAAAIAVAVGPAGTLLPVAVALLAGGLLTLPSGRFQGGVWLIAALLCGFLDGLRLPALLAPLRLSYANARPMQMGFDLGAILIDAFCLLAGFWVLSRLSASIKPGLRSIIFDAVAAALSGMGVFWLVSQP